MVHLEKGQWDCIIGDLDDKVAQHHKFLPLWKATPLMSLRNDTSFGTFSHLSATKMVIPFTNHLGIKTL